MYGYLDQKPKLAPNVFVAPNAQIFGDVQILEQASIWFGSVIRGDVQSIHIGHHTNIQDLCVIHVTRETGPTWIGSEVTVGHRALIHAARIEDRTLIGMGSIIMDHALIQEGAMVAAGALVPPKMVVPPRTLVAGVPAKIIRKVSDDEYQWILANAQHYAQLALKYMQKIL